MYKTIQITEGRLGNLFGGSNISTKKLDKVLNDNLANGFELEFMVRDTVRSFVFWSRERVLVTLKSK